MKNFKSKKHNAPQLARLGLSALMLGMFATSSYAGGMQASDLQTFLSGVAAQGGTATTMTLTAANGTPQTFDITNPDTFTTAATNFAIANGGSILKAESPVTVAGSPVKFTSTYTPPVSTGTTAPAKITYTLASPEIPALDKQVFTALVDPATGTQTALQEAQNQLTTYIAKEKPTILNQVETANPNYFFKNSDMKTLIDTANSYQGLPSSITLTGNNGKTTTITSNNWTDIQKQTQDFALVGNGIVGMNAKINLNGNIVNVQSTIVNGTTTSTVSSTDIPSLNQTFTGTRAKVQKEMAAYLKSNASFIASSAAMSSNGLGSDGTTPNGHMTQMSYYDSVIDINGVGAGNFSAGKQLSAGDNSELQSRFTSDFRFANYSYTSSGMTTTSQLYTLSLGYNLELGNRWGLLFNMPLTYDNQNYGGENRDNYRLALGAGVRIPVSNYLNMGSGKWDIIPLVRVGGVGLGQKATSSFAYSTGIQSNLGLPLGHGFAFSIQNQYTYNTNTLLANNLLTNGVTYSVPDINTHVYRNGFQLSKDYDTHFLGKTLTSNFKFADVRFSGRNVSTRNDSQQEVGVGIGLKDANGSCAANLNVVYTMAKGYQEAVAANVGLCF